MASTYRRYRRNSPEALARVVAMLLLGDGRIDPGELDFMDRVGVFGILGVPRDLFMRVASELVGELRADAESAVDRHRVRQARIDAALDVVEDRDQQYLVCAVLVYLAESDHSLAGEETAMLRQAFRRWDVSAEALEKELNVPRSRTRHYFDAVRPAGT